MIGRLGLSPPGMSDPPVSAREGVSRQWAATLREAVHKTEGRAFHVGLVDHGILPPGLQLDHDLGLDAGGLDVMALVLMPALLSGLAGNIVGLERPRMSPPLASFEAEGSMGDLARGPPKSGAPSPSHEAGLDLPISNSMDDVLKYEPYSQEMSQQDSPILDVNPEDISEIVIDDSDDLNKTIEELQAPIVEPTPSKKHGRDEPVSSSSPSKRHVAQEGETSAPPLEDDLPKGVKLKDILPKQYDTLCSDHPWVHKVMCSLLGLEAGTMPSQEDIDSSLWFVSQATCKDAEPPEIITK